MTSRSRILAAAAGIGWWRCPRRRSPAACCSAWSGPSRWSSPPARPAWPRCWRARATSSRRWWSLLSGGNIDPLLLSKLLRHGLSAAGRFLGFRCRVPDYPGSLAALLALLAELGANVLEVSHERLAPRLRVDEVEVVLQMETRGPEHCEHVKDALRDGGVRPGVRLTSDQDAVAEDVPDVGDGLGRCRGPGTGGAGRR